VHFRILHVSDHLGKSRSFFSSLAIPNITNQLAGVLLIFSDRNCKKVRSSSSSVSRPGSLSAKSLWARLTDSEACGSKPCQLEAYDARLQNPDWWLSVFRLLLLWALMASGLQLSRQCDDQLLSIVNSSSGQHRPELELPSLGCQNAQLLTAASVTASSLRYGDPWPLQWQVSKLVSLGCWDFKAWQLPGILPVTEDYSPLLLALQSLPYTSTILIVPARHYICP
jgi:hypothetical protein